jgi:multiple sugar transport system ATP-binding protein
MNFIESTAAAVNGAGVTVALPGGGSIAVPVQPGRLQPGAKVTLGVRPEHLRPGDRGELMGEVLVVERLGGETFLYTQLPDQRMIVVQADGEIPTRVHDRIAVELNAAHCHLFDEAGLAVERAERHPLADMRRLAARKAS